MLLVSQISGEKKTLFIVCFDINPTGPVGWLTTCFNSFLCWTLALVVRQRKIKEIGLEFPPVHPDFYQAPQNLALFPQ